AARDAKLLEERRGLRDRLRAHVGDRLPPEAHRERFLVEALALALRARLVDLEPFDPGVEHVVLGAGLRALLVPLHLVDLEARAVAAGAPAVLRVVGEEARVELAEAAAARGARALHREDLRLAPAPAAPAHMQHALAQLERGFDRGAKRL